ncbi:HAD hydrolase-like protein [Candidatus Bipolaricaulota bacterium]|nr:HAD hydrolase-like protein [Candidatus Bipolaricaulota bacterium]
MVSLALERLNLNPEECVMIGDSRVDMVAAQECGLKSVFVKTGSAEERDLDEIDISPDFTLDSIEGIF